MARINIWNLVDVNQIDDIMLDKILRYSGYGCDFISSSFSYIDDSGVAVFNIEVEEDKQYLLERVYIKLDEIGNLVAKF